MPRLAASLLLIGVIPGGASAQVDTVLAAQYFEEAAELCRREGGRLWGVSLCGPMVIADPTTGTIAANQPVPAANRPAALGYANAAMMWGGVRWSTYVWQMIPADKATRGHLLMHELFHRVQPELGFFLNEPNNEHMDTPDGRYWMQLEWRALAKALVDTGTTRSREIADALGFRARRHQLFPKAAENERVLEINEGLPEYTGVVAASATPAEAARLAIEGLDRAAQYPTLVRQFAYGSGAAYGLLLDVWSPGWTRRFKPGDDLATLVRTTSGIQPNPDVNPAAYGGEELWAAEQRREVERVTRRAELRRIFVDGPVLILPGTKSASFRSTGLTPLGEAGTVIPTYRTTAEWGSLEADLVLVASDRSSIRIPAPARVEGAALEGDQWKLTIAEGWVVRPGSRPGDYQLVRGE